MGFNKKFFSTGGIVAASPSVAAFDPLQNFETVTYTGNGGTQKITGYIRKGAAFNGSSSYIDLPLTSLFGGKNTLSVSFWFNTTTTSRQRLFSDYAQTSRNCDITIDSGNLEIVTDYGATSDTHTTTSTYNDGNWHHLVVSISATQRIIYINKTPVDTITLPSGSWDGSSQKVTVGAIYTSSYGQYFDGSIDQVRIFDKALSEQEVTTLSNETYASSTKSTTDIFNDGSGVALYELDEDANSSNFGQAASFNGSSSIIKNTALGAAYRNQTTLTLSGWIKTSGHASSTQINSFIGFTNTNEGSTDMLLYFRASQGNVIYITNKSDGAYTLVGSGTTNIADNNWHHFAFVADSSGNKLYLDGVQETITYSTGSSTTQILMPNDLNQFNLGANQDSGGVQWHADCELDQVRIYNTALSSGDVTKLYNESSDVPTSGLVAHYKLDGNAEDVLDTYDGTASNVTYSAGVYGGTPTNINFLGMAFQPDFVWVKSRTNTAYHILSDVIRESTTQKTLFSNETLAATNENYIDLDTNGFTVYDNGLGTGTNGSSNNYVAWCWKAGGAAVSDTTTGDIDADISANTDAGFSIVKYTGNSLTNQTIPHGLDSAPELIIIKNLDDETANWLVAGENIDFYLNLNRDVADPSSSSYNWITNRGATTFTVGSQRKEQNINGQEFIAYCFHSVDGYQKVGSYTGTGAAGNQVNVGFRPRFLMVKRTDAAGGWGIVDSLRSKELYPHVDLAEIVNNRLIINDDGFVTTDSAFNESGSANNFIYLAIA